jgi:hypothetical protein
MFVGVIDKKELLITGSSNETKEASQHCWVLNIDVLVMAEIEIS